MLKILDFYKDYRDEQYSQKNAEVIYNLSRNNNVKDPSTQNRIIGFAINNPMFTNGIVSALSEHTQDPEIQNYIYDHFKDPQVRQDISKNPNLSLDLQSKLADKYADPALHHRTGIRYLSANTKSPEVRVLYNSFIDN